MADRFIHNPRGNPWCMSLLNAAIALPGDLKVLNCAVTGSGMKSPRMALGATNTDICSMVRGLHSGSLAAEAMTRRRRPDPDRAGPVRALYRRIITGTGRRSRSMGRDQPAHDRAIEAMLPRKKSAP